MRPGFVPALGTPLDKDGNLVEKSLRKHVGDQIAAGAVGLLCLGSMGIEAFIRDDVYPSVALTALDEAAGRVPVFIGAMDTSLARVKKRIAPLEDSDAAGFVFTAPFYSPATREQMMNFFKGCAALTDHKILLYDLPVVTQSKITPAMVLELIKTVPNFIGIKSADLVMFRNLKRNPDVPEDFITVYSGLDSFDVAYRSGIDNCLDGMLSCTPKNTSRMFKALEKKDYGTAAKCLDNITSLRDCFIKNDLMPSFTHSMNLLGYEGDFAQDYMSPITEKAKENVKLEMIRIGEIKG
ncbi:MAG: dihydrodipicolinate synthase family protein [Clostridia bacterium]|nr:dihydrodipicolinate synthase family protein [Clostridia bacterium]